LVQGPPGLRGFAQPGICPEKIQHCKRFAEMLAREADVVTVDYVLPDMNGESVLRQIKDVNPDIEVIIISEQEKIDTAVELLRMGAYDYIVKTPISAISC
jgi:DNA-binding NtrC family response regulator